MPIDPPDQCARSLICEPARPPLIVDSIRRSRLRVWQLRAGLAGCDPYTGLQAAIRHEERVCALLIKALPAQYREMFYERERV